MLKLQFINAITQEVIREEITEESVIKNFLASFEETKNKNDEVIIFDHGMKAYQAMFLSHSQTKKDHRKVYRFFFKTRVSTIQPR
ncbi:hypothetical protein ABER02_16640 [Rossellomorea marisflavi]|uniref:hypothetical protein n=1 Tax=Rossellomorea marisflavi TaxID=189381 RepID=UPI003D2E7B7D